MFIYPTYLASLLLSGEGNDPIAEHEHEDGERKQVPRRFSQPGAVGVGSLGPLQLRH